MKTSIEKRRDRQRRYREANREKVRECVRRWQNAHPAEKREAWHRWHKAHPEKQAVATRRYRHNNPEKYSQYEANRRVRVRGASGVLTAAEWQECKVRHGYRCYWRISPRCPGGLTDKTATRDHVVPVSKGGSNWISNIVPACGFCNSKKGARVL